MVKEEPGIREWVRSGGHRVMMSCSCSTKKVHSFITLQHISQPMASPTNALGASKGQVGPEVTRRVHSSRRKKNCQKNSDSILLRPENTARNLEHDFFYGNFTRQELPSSNVENQPSFIIYRASVIQRIHN